jgi:hypothetical protein
MFLYRMAVLMLMRRLLFVVNFIVIFVMLLMSSGCGGHYQELTVLSNVSGNVSVLKEGSRTPVNGKIGMNIKKGDIVMAGDNSTATITFFEGSTIDLNPGTRIEINTLDKSQSDSVIILLEQTLGESISHVKKLTDPKSRYEIETVAATAAVRGSTMIVYVASNGITSVGNEEGLISVIAQNIELQIPEGEHSIVVPGEAPGEPEPGSRPKIISTAVFPDTTSDLFDAGSGSTPGKGYIDIRRSQISWTGGYYTAHIELNDPCPVRTDDSSTFFEWDILVDADSNSNTGFKWPLIGNDIGYDYLVRVGLNGSDYWGEVLTISTNASADIEFIVAVYNNQETGNILELYFPEALIGSPEGFNWIVAVRQYLVNDPPDQPSISDKSPDEGHYTFP